MVPLYKPFMPELPELIKILNSGDLSYGTYAKQFEDSLKNYFGTPYVLAVNSYGSAVSVALACREIDYGSDVIVSPMACLASTQPYAVSGLKIVWADIDVDTGSLCPESVRKKITCKTKAIVHNHFCGYPGHIDEINSIGRKNGITVIDDGIECFGTLYKDKKIGNCGTDITIFSLSPIRIPNTIDGGIIVFKNKQEYEKSILIRDLGIDRSNFRDGMGEININCDIKLRGFSAVMNNISGYIGREQMKSVEYLIKKQRGNAALWDDVLKNTEYRPLQSAEGTPNYWVYGIRTPNKEEAIKHFRNKGFYASGVHGNNSIYSVFGDKNELKGVNEFNAQFTALPCGWWVDEIDYGH